MLSLPLPRFFSAVYAYRLRALDRLMLVAPKEALEQRRALDRALDWPVDEEQLRETWGLGDSAAAGQNAMMNLGGKG